MAFDFCVTGNTKLDTSGFTQGVSSMTVAAGTLIADLVKTASSQLTNLAQSAIQNGSIYETSLAKVGTIADLGKLSIQKLGSQITDMSNTMGIAATDIAEATYQAISAGQDTANAVEFAGQAAKLATAGFTSTTSAVDILTTALNAYGLSADQATHVSDVLLTTQNLGKTSVDELSSSMGRVIPLAAAYNVSVENLSSGLAVMTANGIATAEATTYTKSMLNELGDTGSSVGKILQQQTGKSFAQLSADGKSLGDVLQVLYDSVGDDGTAFAGLWSSVEAGTGALSLVSGGADKFNGVLGQMVDSAGATETAYATMTDTFQHSMDSLQTTAENLSIDLFEAMEPGLKEAANWGTDCLNTLTSALNEGGPEAMLQAAGQIISDLAASVTAQLPGLVTSGTEIIVQLAEDIVAATPQLLSSGAEIIGALVQALGVALPQLVSTGIQMISQLSAGLASGIPEFLAKALPLVADFASGLRENIGQIIDAGIELILSLMQGLMDGLPTLIEYLPGIVSDIAGIINDNTPKILEAGIQLILMLGKGLLQAVPTLVANIPQICKAIFDVFTAFRWLDIGSQIVEGLWKGLTGGWATLVKKVGGLAQQLPDIVKRVLGIHSPSKVFDEIGVNTCKGLAQGLSKGTAHVKNAAKTVVASVTDTATQIVDGVTTVTETVTETMANGSTQQKQIITETSQQIIDGVAKTVKTVTERAADGSESVKRSIEAARDVVSTVTATQTALADGAKVTTQTTTETLADGSEQVKRVITSTGTEVIEGVQHTVKTVTTIAADGTQTVAKTIEDAGPQYGSVGELLTTQFRTKLTEGWAQIQSDIQTDALGAIETLATALKDGDLESLGLWAASYFWQACTKEQQTQINSIALGALNQLGSALSGVFGNLSQLAMGLVAQFVPAAASATAGQTALNVAMDANPILLVISLIGMLVGALLNLSGKNKDVANAFQNVWAGVEDFMSYIFEGLMRIVAAGIEGFVILINGLIGLYNSVAWLYGGTIDYISNPAWDYANKIAADRKARQAERKKQQEAANNPSSSGTSANSQKVIESMTDTSKTTRADGSTVTTKVLTEKLQDETGKITQRVTKTVTEAGTKLVDGVERSYKTVTTYVDGIQTKVERSLDDITKTTTGTKPGSTTPTAPTPDKDLTDAVEANTEALLAANSKLAEMVRQANTLVLSDNMAISRSVAASGTAQVAAAANQYHREGDTNIIQNIYSKAQTAADLQREARWEADRAKAQKR